MEPFTLERPSGIAGVVALGAQAGRNDAAAEYIAGGTDMIQLLQENVRRPTRLVDLTAGTGMPFSPPVNITFRLVASTRVFCPGRDRELT